MSFYSIENISIAGIATSVPKNKKTEVDFVRVFGEDVVKKFIKSTGIKSVHQAIENQTASDLAYIAANNLLNSFNIDRGKIGTLLFVTQSPDYRRPASAYVLQNRLGLSIECDAFDVGLGCSGFLYGQQIIQSMMVTNNAQYGLLLLGETASKLVNPLDKSIAMMYGDAGAAVLYERTMGAKQTTLLESDGYRFKSIILPAGGFRDMNPTNEVYTCSDGIRRSKYDIYMDGVSVFSFSTSDVPKAILKYLKKNQLESSDFDYVVLHQANQFIVNQIGRKIQVSKNQMLMSLDEYGNTGGISIPLTLSKYFGNNNQGVKRILASGFGIGLSWGVTNFYLDTSLVLPIVETDDYYKEGKILPSEL